MSKPMASLAQIRNVRYVWYGASKGPGPLSMAWAQLFPVDIGTSVNFGDSLMLVVEQLIAEGHSNWPRPKGFTAETKGMPI